MLKIITGESKISLRIVDWFATNYAKKNYTLYTFTDVNENINRFSTNLFNRWGIGNKETRYGILFVYDFISGKVRIENGYGIEKIYTDKETGAIIDKAIKPRFREAKYFEGIYYAVNLMAEEVVSKETFIKKK